MFKDDDDRFFFPTRSGNSIGSAAERTMLEAVGIGGIRTRMQLHPDGSTTLLKTRGGNAHFYTTPSPEQVVIPPVTIPPYVLTAERMFAPTSITAPSGAFRLTVDFQGNTVQQTTIPLDQYTGTDGTEEWKKYRRYFKWTSGSNPDQFIDYYSDRYSAHGVQIGSGSVYSIYTNEPFNPTLEAAMTLSRAYATFQMAIGLNTYDVVATLVHYKNKANGVLMSAYGYSYTPPDMAGSWMRGYGEHAFRSPSGRKVAYVDYRQNLPGGSFGAPGIHLYDDVTATLTTIHSCELSGSSSEVAVVTGPTSSSGTGSKTQNIEYSVSANFDGDTLVPIVMRIEGSFLGTAQGDAASGAYNEHVEYSLQIELLRGGTAFYTSAESNQWDLTSPATFGTWGHVPIATRIGWLNAPEEWVHAFVIGVATGRSATPTTVFYEQVADVDMKVEIHDFKRGKKYTVAFPSVSVGGEPGSGADFQDRPWGLGYKPSPVGVDWAGVAGVYYGWSVSRSANWNNLYDGQDWTFFAVDSFHNDWPTATDPHGEAMPDAPESLVYDAQGLRPDSSPFNRLRVVGSIFADPKVIVLSVRNPVDPTAYINVAIDRATGTKVNFDNGFGYQVLYKALDALP